MIKSRLRVVAAGVVVLIMSTIVLQLGGTPLTNEVGAAGATYNWTQFGGDQTHSLDNSRETTINTTNVGTLQQLFKVTLPSAADDSPVYLSGVTTANGVENLLFVTTLDGHIMALDAESGATVWSRQYGPGTCTFGAGQACFTGASPVIDPNLKYVYSVGLDGKIHKYQVGNGFEIVGGGWPEVSTLKPSVDKSSSSLSVATAKNGTSFLYATTSSQDDTGDYQGHLTTINLSDGTQHVFNMLCSDQIDVHFVMTPGTPDCAVPQAGVWGRAAVLYDPDVDRIYFASGNGNFRPAKFWWGDTVVELNPDGTSNGGNPLDSYTPSNEESLQDMDLDLGSVAPTRLAPPPNSPVQHLGLVTGKDAMLRLVNLDNLSGEGGPGHLGGEISPLVAVPEGGGKVVNDSVRSQPALWTNPADQSQWIFVDNPNGLDAFRLTLGVTNTLLLPSQWSNFCSVCGPTDGNSPLVANGVLYVAYSSNLSAYDPLTGQVLWQNKSIGNIHWSSPIVDNGVLYITDYNNNLTAFGLSSTTPTPTMSAAATATPTPTLSPTLTPTPTPTRRPRATPTRRSAPTRTPTPDGGGR